MRSTEVKLGEIVNIVDRVAADHDSLHVYSISKHDGFVRSDKYFKKQVHSADISSYKVVHPGDFAFSPIHLDEGSIALARHPGLISPMYKVFEIDHSRCDADYLIRALRSPNLIRIYGTLGDGSVHRRRSVSFERFSQIRLLLPAMDKQRRIAALLNKADELRCKRKCALDILDGLTQSIFLEMFGNQFKDSGKFKTGKLLDFCSADDDIRCGPFGTQLHQSDFKKEGVPLWGIKHVNAQFKLPTVEFVSEIKAKELANYALMPGDLVMTRKGTIGNVAVYPSNNTIGIMHSDLLRMRFNSKLLDPIFISAQLKFDPAIKRQISLISGGSIMAGINVGKLKSINIFVPDIGIQEKFAKVNLNISLQKEKLFADLTLQNINFSSLQHRAFTGQL